MTNDHYSVLEIAPDATSEEVRQAYRRQARRSHPDLHPDDRAAGLRFRLVTEAYRVLSDPATRIEYDRAGGRRPEASWWSEDEGPPSPFQQAGRRWARDGRDVLAVMELRLDQALKGGTVTVGVDGPVACSACDGEGLDRHGRTVACWGCGGTGSTTYSNRLGETEGTCLTCGGEGLAHTDRCPMCEGEGTITGHREVPVSFPAGIDEGAGLEIAGAGGPGGRGGRPGDLHVFVTIAPHPVFVRHGADLAVTVPVHFAEATLGAEIDVPVIDGRVTLRVPPGTQGGTVLRVAGRGAVTAEGSGDLLVTVHIAVPSSLDSREEEVIAGLLPAEPHSLREHLFDG